MNSQRLQTKGINLPTSPVTNCFTVEPSKSGPLTAYWKDDIGNHFYVHSKYNPLSEAEQFAEQARGKKHVIVYGWGLGYHIAAILQNNPELEKLTVLDGNPLGLVALLHEIDLSFLEDERLELQLYFDEREFIHSFSSLFQTEGIDDLLFHTPSLRLLETSSPQMALLLKEWKMKLSTARDSILEENLHIHLHMLKKYPNIASFFPKGEVQNPQPGVVVAAGPSLNKNVELLKELKGQAVIISVGTAAKVLEAHGITPDYVIIIDPYPVVGKQLEGSSLTCPLIIFPTTHPSAYEGYKGDLLFAFQHGVDLCEQYAKEMNLSCIETGGSVATAALDILIQMRCEPIVLVGQDLAYTNGKTHADHSVYENNNVSPQGKTMQVEAYGGGMISTSFSWYIFKKWIERRLEREPNTKVINATEGGARIVGTLEMTLKNAINTYVREV